MSEDLAVNPITEWEVQTVPAMSSLLLKFKFISTPFQRPDEAHGTPLLAVTVEQAKELIEVLKRGVAKVEKEAPASPPGQRH